MNNTVDKNDLPPFRPVHSRQSKLFSFLTGAIVILLILACIIIMGLALYVVFVGDAETGLKVFVFIIALLLNGIWILICWKGRNHTFTDTYIDEEGIHFMHRKKNKTIKFYKWSHFQKSSEGTYDVEKLTTSGRVNGARISSDHFKTLVKINNEITEVSGTFRGGHIFYMNGNRQELIGAALLGFAHFRPDLKIDPQLFSTFFIDEETYRFNQTEYRKVMIGAGILLIILLVLVFWFI